MKGKTHARDFGFAIVIAILASGAKGAVVNGDFESPAILDGSSQLGPPSSWAGGFQLHNPDESGGVGDDFIWPQAQSGQQYVDIGNISSTALSQSFTVSSPGIYSISWYDNTALHMPPELQTAPYSINLLNASLQTIFSYSFDSWHETGAWQARIVSQALTPGIYTISFVSQNGEYRTDTLIDSVVVPPHPFHIIMQPQSQVGYWGKSVEFSVEAAYGVQPYTYQWLKDGSEIVGATSSQLILTNLQAENAGSYTVTVSDAAQTSLVSQSATLVVSPAGVSIATYAGLTIDGVVGQTYGIQATTDLSNPSGWVNIANFTLTQPTQIWYDSQSTSQQPKRFYRVVAGPISIP